MVHGSSLNTGHKVSFVQYKGHIICKAEDIEILLVLYKVNVASYNKNIVIPFPILHEATKINKRKNCFNFFTSYARSS